jgi:hypothetical protein
MAQQASGTGTTPSRLVESRLKDFKAMELDLTTHTTHLFLYPAGQVRDFENEARTTTSAAGPSLGNHPSSHRASPSSSIAHLNLQDDGDNKDGHGGSNSAVLLVTVHLTVPPKATPPKTIQSLVVTVTAIETLSCNLFSRRPEFFGLRNFQFLVDGMNQASLSIQQRRSHRRLE